MHCTILVPIPLFYIQKSHYVPEYYHFLSSQTVTVCNTLFWTDSLPDSGYSPTSRTIPYHKNKEGEKKEVEGVWEIQAYYTHRYCSPISSSLITDFHSPTFPGAAFSGTGYLYTASYLTDLKQLLTNGLFQQDASCVWFNSVYIYVTESNQVGLCAVTIMFAQLHLGRKALPLQY